MTERVSIRDFPIVDGRRVLPDDVVYIGRAVPRVGMKASRWANPYRIGQTWRINGHDQMPMDRDTVVWRYHDHLDRELRRDADFLEPLRGHRIACWCARGEWCHGDVIVEWLDAHRPMPHEGEPIIFGYHALPDRDAEAPAWPVTEAKITQTIRRAAGLPVR